VLLPCRPLGVVLLDQHDDDGRRVRNDRVIAMPTWHDRLGEFERASDLPARLRQEIEAFFVNVTVLTGKNARVLGWKGAKRALSLVESSASSFATGQARPPDATTKRKEISMATTRQKSKVSKVMHEHKEGKLKSGSGRKVKSRKKAIAIAMSESGQSKRSKKKSS
jgi:hypothetical protein